jgi:hypothetical protein
MLQPFSSRMDILRQDVHYAVRSLLNTPAFTATAVLTLALGIGVNTAMFTVANTLLLRPPPFEHAEQLYWVYDTNEKQHLTGERSEKLVVLRRWPMASRSPSSACCRRRSTSCGGLGDLHADADRCQFPERSMETVLDKAIAAPR